MPLIFEATQQEIPGASRDADTPSGAQTKMRGAATRKAHEWFPPLRTRVESSTAESNRLSRKVEAAGIEPASADAPSEHLQA